MPRCKPRTLWTVFQWRMSNLHLGVGWRLCRSLPLWCTEQLHWGVLHRQAWAGGLSVLPRESPLKGWGCSFQYGKTKSNRGWQDINVYHLCYRIMGFYYIMTRNLLSKFMIAKHIIKSDFTQNYENIWESQCVHCYTVSHIPLTCSPVWWTSTGLSKKTESKATGLGYMYLETFHLSPKRLHHSGVRIDTEILILPIPNVSVLGSILRLKDWYSVIWD